jgi:hypothetical protein
MRKDRHKKARIRLAYIDGPIAKITIGQIVWCGDRRTVVGRQGPVFTGLEFGGFIDVPHRVSIKNQLFMAFCGIESGLAKDPVRATTAVASTFTP